MRRLRWTVALALLILLSGASRHPGEWMPLSEIPSSGPGWPFQIGMLAQGDGSNVPIATRLTANSTLSHYITSAATTNATSVKATAGNVYGYSLINTTATLYYLRMYNLATAPTCSSGTSQVEAIPVPASTAGAGVQRHHAIGQGFTTGIAYCFTAGGASTNNVAAATGVYITILYK